MKLSGSANNCYTETVCVSIKREKKLKEENSWILGDDLCSSTCSSSFTGSQTIYIVDAKAKAGFTTGAFNTRFHQGEGESYFC